jgi:hypothetical protein
VCGGAGRKAIILYVPYKLLNSFDKIQKRDSLVRELETKVFSRLDAPCIREGKSPDDKKNSAFSTKFFANFHYFCVLFPSSRRNSTKPQHFSMCHYHNAKQHSGIIYYILQQSHVMHQLVLLNLVVIYIIIVVTHETIDGQPGRQYIITFGLAYGSGQPFSLAHSTT